MMFRRSLQLLSRHFSKSKQIFTQQSHKLSDSYQLSESQIAAILHKPAIIQNQSNPIQSKSPEQRKDLIYGLPKKNEPFPLVYDEQDLIQILQTPTQNLYQVLKLDGDSTFNKYLSSLHSEFHHQIDLYGDESEKPVIDLKTLQFKELIKTNSEYLLFLRQKFLVNPNIPGTIELQDANSFMQLRPIQQFRHTPLIPISESTMQKFQEEMKQRHNKAFYFAVKTQTMINVGLFIVSLAVVFTLISQVRKGSDKKALEVMRMKHQRLMGEN